MTHAARARLAAQQAELVRALVAQGPIPAGFDADRVRACGRSLVQKRRQSVARAWPRLVGLVENTYVEQFTTYARLRPLPPSASPLEDGREFLRWLESREALSDAGRLESLVFDLRFQSTPLGLRRRRGLGVKLVKLRDVSALAIAIRLPKLGVRWWRLPLGKTGKPGG